MDLPQPPTRRELLAKFRIARGLTQEALAEQADIPMQTYRKMERSGPYRPSQTGVGHTHLKHIEEVPQLTPRQRAGLEAATWPDDAPPPATLPDGSMMRYHPNPRFTGRTREPRALAWLLDVYGVLHERGQVVAISSRLPGIGKTQLAAEFVHRYGRWFQAVYWLDFGDPDGVRAQAVACGGPHHMDLCPGGFAQLAPDEQEALVRRAWEQPLPRLLVFDNCEDPALAQYWLPTSGGCGVLITTQRQEWSAALGIRQLTLGVLSEGESMEFLGEYRQDLTPATEGIAYLVGAGLPAHGPASSGQPLRAQAQSHRRRLPA